jgi:hypothetical protein
MEDLAMDDDPGAAPADDVLDGNAVAGAMHALFGRDMTVVPGRCAHCGRMSMVGAMRAYTRAPGAVLRCPHCDRVVIRIVRTEVSTLVDLRGAAFLRFDHE